MPVRDATVRPIDASVEAGKDETPFGSRLEDLAWIDEFVANVRPYVRVRPDEGALIKVPIETYQINKTGARLLDQALRGETIQRIAIAAGADRRPERIQQIHAFFCDVRDLLSGRLGDGTGRLATEVSRFEGSFTRYPVLSEIAVTRRCNLACRFCYAGCETARGDTSPEPRATRRLPRVFGRNGGWRALRAPNRAPRHEEMTTEQVFRVIGMIAQDARVPSLSFTGGEPTLREDLPALIAEARRRGLRVNLITNGVACASKALVERLVEAGLNSAQVSLEGPTAEIHDALACRPGAFDKTLQGIHHLRDAGLRMHCNTTICQPNAPHLPRIIDLAKSLGLPRVSMNHVIPAGTAALEQHVGLLVSYSRIAEPVLRARDHAERAGLEFLWYSPAPFCIFNPIAHGLGNKGCAACDGLLHVSASGEVLPCSSFSRGVGNILEKGFSKVWFGRQALHYKKKRMAHRICRTCEHFALCQGACILYWRQMGYGELLQANAKNKLKSEN